MPLVVPYLTLGGPADSAKRRNYFQRWWDVYPVEEDDNEFGDTDEDVMPLLQAQRHRAVMAMPLYNTLTALPFGMGEKVKEYIPHPMEQLRAVLAAKGDEDTNPYRIIVAVAPHYFCVATTDDPNVVKKDWKHLEEVLRDVSPSDYPSKQALALAIAVKVAQAMFPKDTPSSIQQLLTQIVDATNATEINRLFHKSVDDSATSDEIKRVLYGILLLKVRMMRREQGEHAALLQGGDAAAAIPVQPVQPKSTIEDKEEIGGEEEEWFEVSADLVDIARALEQATTRIDLDHAADLMNSYIRARQIQLGGGDDVTSTDNNVTAMGGPPPPPPPPPPPALDLDRPRLVINKTAKTGQQQQHQRAAKSERDMLIELQKSIEKRRKAMEMPNTGHHPDDEEDW